MWKIRHFVAAAALAGLATAPAHAQTQPQLPPNAEAAKPAPEKKVEPAKKAAPAKTAPKAPAKDAKKKAEPAKKPPAPPPKSLELRDEKGNVIPISPDAYDISSATKPAPGKATPKK